MFQLAKQVGNQTAIKNEKTKTGLKDTYLDGFLDRMAASYKDCRGTTAKQSALDEFVATLPQNVLSPIWRIRGRCLSRPPL